MILQALKEYYDRKANDPASGIAPNGWEWRPIHYIIVLDKDGIPVGIEKMIEGTGKKMTVKSFLVPKGVKRTSGINSSLLCENPEYAIGVELNPKKPAAEKHKAFLAKLDELGEVNDAGLRALKLFCRLPFEEKAAKLSGFPDSWEAIQAGKNVNIAFQLQGETDIVARSPAVRNAIDKMNVSSGGDDYCLVTGEPDAIEKTHPSIKGVRGGNPTGTNIVSFNMRSVESFGKEQGENAPVGSRSAFAYTTALNALLGKDSLNNLTVGDATTVFWSEKPTELETNFPRFFREPPKDDPDQGIKAVRALFESIHTGAYTEDQKKIRFFVLGLAPNAARIMIRFWIVSTVGEMSENIKQFFDDTEIIHGSSSPDRLSLFRLLVSTAVQRKAENIPPNVEGDFVRAILQGLPYPLTLLSAAVRRNRAERDVNYERAALIKACLNRSLKTKSLSSESIEQEELTVSLNQQNTNIGYVLGRLFAVLEKLQRDANPGINATIRDRYYGAASGTPLTAFPNLLRLKNHHLSKLTSERTRVYYEKLLTEVLSLIDDFPGHLSLADQGRFAIGYYHQIQEFYKKRSKDEETPETN
ncbi:MAG: type I-C CRISPR-associated protein Cas8c/Csd1 [Thermoguttaceae bacterium]|nr:type I-C CRISPR-associated protein Cas8c/Csd1 [Thermoguttaceae bacterium]